MGCAAPEVTPEPEPTPPPPEWTIGQAPETMSQGRCVAFNNEILVIGSNFNANCYSYNIDRKEWVRFATDNRRDLFVGHNVAILPKSDDLSHIFGFGFSKSSQPSMRLQYKSVWDRVTIKPPIDEKEEQKLELTEEAHKDDCKHELKEMLEWETMAPPEWETKFKAYGGRSQVCEGSLMHRGFLLITGGFTRRFSSVIDFVDLNSLEPRIHEFALPSTKWVWHSHVMGATDDWSRFIVFRRSAMYECNLLQWEPEIEMDCKDLSEFAHPGELQNCGHCTVHNSIVTFGGEVLNPETEDFEFTDAIWVLSILESPPKWRRASVPMPKPFRNTAAVLSADGKHIHVIGGEAYKSKKQNNHWIVAVDDILYGPLEKSVIHYWASIECKIELPDDCIQTMTNFYGSGIYVAR